MAQRASRSTAPRAARPHSERRRRERHHADGRTAQAVGQIAAAEYRYSMLSRELADQFQQDGFCAADGFLTREEVAAFLNSMERVCTGATVEHHDGTRVEMEPDQGRDGNRVRRMYEPRTPYPEFRGLSSS